MKHFIIILIFIAANTFITIGQEHRDLLDPRIREILIQGLDGEQAKEHVIQITKFHRVQGSQGYRDAANYVLQQLRSYGFSEKDAYIESFKSDGKIIYQTWQSPSGWDVEDAELSIIKPTQEKLVSFKEIPMSLMTYSNPGDVTAEIVWVGTGTNDSNYVGKNVKEKFVLTTGYGGDVHRLAVLKYGAKAVVRYIDEKRAVENPDMIHYSGLWPRSEELEKTTFGFNISYKQGEQLKQLIESGEKAVLRGWVKGKGLHPSFMDVVVAHIRGKERPQDELIFSAHLDHPKECANDNASGSGAILDIARTLKHLLDSNKLPPPKRSFRFLWVPEWYGTMAYIDAHPELAGPAEGGKFLANINLDMVGENLELLHSKLYIIRTPNSVPSCLNDVVENMAAMVDRMNIRTPNGSQSQFNYRLVPFRGGSDHLMFLDRKIPSVMLSHSDYTHHTTYDTPDKVDPVELERCEMIATASLWYLANLSVPQGIDLLEYHRLKAYGRLGEIVRKVRVNTNSASIRALPMVWAESEQLGVVAMNLEVDAAKSILTFNDAFEIFNPVDLTYSHLGKRFEHIFILPRSLAEERGYAADYAPDLNEQPDNRIPVRLTRGPLDFRLPESKLKPKEAEWYQSKGFPLNENQRFELVNFIDGKRTVSECRNLFIAEYFSIPDSVVTRYFDDLVKVGVIKWK
ncbi:MAG: DUF4910 domain-containing protein [Bacteroidota bacterium]|nr:DUF4910 domain-containing protein [Bacteroidota bacterium]